MTNVPNEDWAAEQISAALAHARAGNVVSAESIIKDVRSRVVVESAPRIAIGSIFVEGIIFAYRAEWDAARDRFLRAAALSRTEERLRSEFLAASAWLAFVESNTGNFHSAGRYAAAVLKEDSRLDSHTACRAGLVLATLLQHAGDAASANVWYSYARRKAESARDSALVSIVIFDSAVMRVFSARVDRYIAGAVLGDLRLDAIFAESSANYDRISGVRVLEPLCILLRSQVLNLQREYESAMGVAGGLISSSVGLSGTDLVRARLEYLWAKSHLAADKSILSEVEDIAQNLRIFSDADDLAIAYAMIAGVLGRIGESTRSKICLDQSAAHYEKYVAWSSEFREFLSNQLPDVH